VSQCSEREHANTSQLLDDSIDERLDEFLEAEAFNLRCSLTGYKEELKRYGVILCQDSFLNKDETLCLFQSLKAAIQILKTNTDKIEKAKHELTSLIKEFDNVFVWGLFYQILILQGLCTLLEQLVINEGDSGYNEAQSIYDWLTDLLIDKEIGFSLKPYGDNDLKRLEPFCKYLLSTNTGQMVQKALNNEITTDTLSDERADAQQLPDELNTDRANKYFEKAIKAGIINYNKGRYGKEANITKAQLAYFLEKVFCPNNTDKFPEQALNILFNESRLGKARGANIDNKDGKPRGYERIDEVFKE
jgi:hypothetical protein